jgi:hypothetical protein
MTTVTFGYRNSYHREYQRKLRESGQRLPKIPRPKYRHRRQAAMDDFKEFCRIYLKARFKLKWSPNHHYAADRIQTSVDSGEWYAWAMERGGGKSTLCEAGVMWAVLRGTCPFVGFILATADLAKSRIENVKTELRYNKKLAEDFPDAVLPFVALEDEARKATGQRTSDGEKTNVGWGDKAIQFAWIESDHSTCPGAIIEARGLHCSIRGLLKTLPNGESLRPKLIVVDDPQTRQSAKSPSQTQTRLETLNGDLAFLVGPGESLSALCPCTKIYEGDLADQILNRDLHPEWHGVTMRMVESFPTNVGLWDQYAQILKTSQKADKGVAEANKFYRANRAAMDADAKVSWPENHRKDELSGIQHAMNLKIRDESAFWAECQNQPIIPQDDLEVITADQLCAKITGHTRGVVPDNCSVVTAFTDFQIEHMFWMVCAWTPDFTGYVIDYGAWPDQSRLYFTRRDVRKKLGHKYAGDENGIIFGALTDLGNKLAGARYKKLSGGELTLSRWCMDIGFRPTPIQAYAVQSPYRGIITLTRGVGVGAKNTTPFNEAQRAKTWKTTHGHWFWADGPGPAKIVRFDANHWKKRIHNGLLLSIGSKGSIQLFQASEQQHRMIADHLLSEKATKVEAKGRIVYEFEAIPGRDNEGLDCLVGCALGASICGITPDSERVQPPKKKSINLAELQRQRWAREGRA